MALSRLHKLAWFNVTLRLAVVISLLLPRVALGDCHCGSECGAKPQSAVRQQQSPQAKARVASAAPKCCCSGSSSCSCCQPEQESSDKRANTTEREPTKQVPSSPGQERSPTDSGCPDDCGCRQIEMRWVSPAPLAARSAELNSLEYTAPVAETYLALSSQVAAGASVLPLPHSTAAPLQPLLCRWQE